MHAAAMTKRWVTVVAVVMVLMGGVWFLQGMGVLGRSGEGMTGDQTWSYIGAIVVLSGAGLMIWPRRKTDG
jgi:hypothetical protein